MGDEEDILGLEKSSGDISDIPKELLKISTMSEDQTVQFSMVRHTTNEANPVPLWLITFTDVMALMLTFFVLLYSMSAPKQEEWDAIIKTLNTNFSEQYARQFFRGSQDVISIDKIDTSRALDLGYLKALIANLLKQKGIENIVILQNEKRLIISLPSELLFKSASSEVDVEGKKILFALGGALSRVKNRIEVEGHTDPQPIRSSGGEFQTNWELSLARSASVAKMLRDVGYSREIAVKGLSSGRFEELSKEENLEARYKISRRVDIIIMEDDGKRKMIPGAQ
ncbi:MAG: OmpA family protein [Alphaproteobacteria bacterium]|nr:OmpA family protein [Alphaproteobacteria bacterium]